jgi:phage-related protein
MSLHEIETYWVEDWLKTKVDPKSQAIFLHILEIFEQFGEYASNPASDLIPRSRLKHLFDGISEIRVGQYRLAYFWQESTCVLLHGIQKKRDDWPDRDLKLLKKRQRLYLDRLSS